MDCDQSYTYALVPMPLDIAKTLRRSAGAVDVLVLLSAIESSLEAAIITLSHVVERAAREAPGLRE